MLGYTYLAYIFISLGITFWVGRTLNSNGRIFLMESYADRPQLADAINQMLLVGFYLINIGYIAFTMRIVEGNPQRVSEAMEFLSTKIGLMAIVLGVMHFGLMYALQRYAQISAKAPKTLKPSRPVVPEPTA